MKNQEYSCKHAFQQMMTGTPSGSVIPVSYTKTGSIIDADLGPLKAYTRVYCISCTEVRELLLFDKSKPSESVANLEVINLTEDDIGN